MYLRIQKKNPYDNRIFKIIDTDFESDYINDKGLTFGAVVAEYERRGINPSLTIIRYFKDFFGKEKFSLDSSILKDFNAAPKYKQIFEKYRSCIEKIVALQ